MKNIPLGLSSYKQAIDENYLLVDKTKEILYLLKKYKFAFFSRPRRFGKSITLDTIALLFSKGLEPYFKGTFIAKNNEDGTPRWNETTYPVISLDFSGYTSNSIDIFRKKFVESLRYYDDIYDLDKTNLNIDIAQTFSDFVVKISKKYTKGFVLLVDEYDAPLNALIDHEILFEEFRSDIRALYAKIKESTISSSIKFMLVTGITRFKDVSIFSAGSNIVDISYDSNIATIVGYTREEIEKYFKEYIDIAIEKQHHCKVSSIDSNTYQLYKSNLLDELALNYDNICYDSFGKKSVYSTWSINNFFVDAAGQEKIVLKNYWYDNGGLPTILLKYMQSHLIDFSAFYDKEISLDPDTFKNPTSLQTMDPNILMAQTGYLSLKKGYELEEMAVLTIPNLELRRALSRLTLHRVFNDFYLAQKRTLKKYIQSASAQNLFDKFNEILAKVPRENGKYNFENEHQVKTVIQMFVLGADMNCYREVYESKGHPDLVIELDDRIIVIEFKYVTNSKEVDDKLTEAITQIKDRDYGQSFDCNKTRLKMAVVYDANEKKLVAFKEC